MRQRFHSIDWLLYLFPILLWLSGCVVLWSLTFASPDKSTHLLAIKQLIFGLIGLVIMVCATWLDYRSLKSAYIIVGLITLVLLVAVEYLGKTSLGATRWIDLKVFQLQPSEIAKIATVIFLSAYLSRFKERIPTKALILIFLVMVIPLALVGMQPDLGTAIILTVTTVATLLLVHLQRIHYIVLAAAAGLIIFAGVMAYAQVPPFKVLLRDYQRHRIATFLNPESDPLGKGYNVRQAIIAVGNGGLYGRGLGVQIGQLSQLNFLPKAYTDFIFAALAESTGFLGAVLVLLMYMGLFWRMVVTAMQSNDYFAHLLCLGFTVVILASVAVNVGMNLGVMPVTGIPLPFLSAGGTALIMSFFGVGMVQSVTLHRRALTKDK